VLPTVYQGSYSLLDRSAESVKIPLLRKLNIRFAGYSPLAGGLLAGTIKSESDPIIPGSRFDNNTYLGTQYRERFFSRKHFKAIESIEEAAAPFGLSLKEVAFRWLQHHSKLLPSDSVILGVSNANQLRGNIEDCEKGPLPEAVVSVVDSIQDILTEKD